MSQDPYSSPAEGAQAGAYEQPSQPPAYAYTPPPSVQAAPDKVKRFLAVLIDGILVAIVSWILGAIIPGVGALVGAVAGLVLYLARDVALDGQSPGKKIIGLRAVTASGGRVSINDSVMRNATLSIASAGSVIAALPVIGFLGTIIMFAGGLVGLYECFLVITDKPRLGDTIAHTHVINEGVQAAVA